MTEPRVELVVQGRVYVLTSSASAPPVVPEASAQFYVAGPADRVLHDDEPLALHWAAKGTVGVAALDLTNRIGYHRLSVLVGRRGYEFDYRTDSAKATWEAVMAMAERIAADAYSYTRQFAYTLPTGQRRRVRVPAVEFGWLQDRMVEIARITRDVAANPGQEAINRVVTSFQSQRMSVPATLRLLRERPELLEPYEGGPIRIAGREYAPTAVRVRRPGQRPARVEHQALSGFLRNLVVSCGQVRTAVAGAQRPQVDTWLQTLGTLRALPVVRAHDRPGLPSDVSPVATILEQQDERYGRLRTLRAEAAQIFAPAGPSEAAARVHLKNVSEIFQTFVALTVGHAFGMQTCDPGGDLRARDSRGRSMTSAQYDLYYDVHPPVDVLQSWRDGTARPAGERPDVVVHDRLGGRVAVLDAKFKAEAGGTLAAAADLFEMQGYLQSFGLQRGGIVYPGPPADAAVIEGGGNRLLEIPVSPDDPTLHDRLRTAVEDLF